MLKKSLLLVGISSLSLLTACQYEAFSEDKEFYKESGNAVHVSDKNEMYNSKGDNGGDNDIGTDYGFVRHQKSPIPNDRDKYKANSEMPNVDREKVADMITKMAIILPDVNDVGTLVTDEEVLIAYETDSENRFETADQVKKTAISIVPRYYHVYVSDDPLMIDEIQKYGRLDANSRDIDRILDTTVKEMLHSPQGRKLSDGENANGEMLNEINEGVGDEDMNKGGTKTDTKNMNNKNDENNETDSNNTDTNDRSYRNNRL
ncbi:YhcN/YlaJ family sporulation lipoprotein [Bacillus sp. DJP31]|uniref:YhcN/YlaJ family sporulation lipoprotein n=1 Tax=Bacillus sp. DJP31 TaxID=3409789 RepID=UPI003BB6ACDA